MFNKLFNELLKLQLRFGENRCNRLILSTLKTPSYLKLFKQRLNTVIISDLQSKNRKKPLCKLITRQARRTG
jgi:hypothetical protein